MVIDLLMWANFYWRFVMGNIIRGKTGPAGIQTTIGWVLNGSAEIKATTPSVNVINTSHVLHISKVDVNINQENSTHEIDPQLQRFLGI